MHYETRYDTEWNAVQVPVFDSNSERFLFYTPGDPGGHWFTEVTPEGAAESYWVDYRDPLAAAFYAFAENTGFQAQEPARIARAINARYGVGLSDAQLIAAVPVYGAVHRAQFNSGYTNASNYYLIGIRAVLDAIRANVANPQPVLQRIVIAENPQVVAGARDAAGRWLVDERDDVDMLGNLVRGAIIAIAAFTLGPAAWGALGEIFSGIASEVITGAASQAASMAEAAAEFAAERAAEVAAQAAMDAAAQAAAEFAAERAAEIAAQATADAVAQAAAEHAAQVAAQAAADAAATQAAQQAAEFAAERAAEVAAQAAQSAASQAAQHAAEQLAQQALTEAAQQAVQAASQNAAAAAQQVADEAVAKAFADIGNAYEQSLATSSVQNAALAEVGGALPAGTLASMIGAEAAAGYLASAGELLAAGGAATVSAVKGAAQALQTVAKAAGSAGLPGMATTGAALLRTLTSGGAKGSAIQVNGVPGQTLAPGFPYVDTGVPGILGNYEPVLRQLALPAAILGGIILFGRRRD